LGDEMKKYYVLENKEKNDKTAVKKGFSWPAFFLGTWWAMWHEMWLVFAILFILTYGINIMKFQMLNNMSPGLSTFLFFLSLAAWLLPGFLGNKWRVYFYKTDGYEVVGEMEAKSISAAYNILLEEEAGSKNHGGDGIS